MIKEMVVIKSINLGPIVIKPYTLVQIVEHELDYDIALDYSGMILKVDKDVYNTLRLGDFFLSKFEYDSAIKEGSELSLVTKEGLVKYSVENIAYKDNKTTYVTLGLKVL